MNSVLQIKRGTDAERLAVIPAAGEPIWCIDTQSFYMGNGVTLGGVTPSNLGGVGGGAPSAHASTHKHGGTDEVGTATPAANAIPKADSNGKLDSWITSGAASGTPSLRALGTSSLQACAGNDARLSDARTPTAHTHPASEISDSTAAGRSLLTAADAAAQRSSLGLGTSAILNVPASGNAASGEVVKGNDTRLTDSRTPLTHSHTSSDVTDFAEAVDDRVAALFVAGTNITLTYNDASNTFTVSSTAASGDTVVAVSYASSITPNLSSGNIFEIGTLTGPITIDNPTGTPVDGKRYTFRLNQDSTGGRSISWGTAFRFGIDLTAADLATNPNAENRVVFIYNATSAKYEASGLTRF